MKLLFSRLAWVLSVIWIRLGRTGPAALLNQLNQNLASVENCYHQHAKCAILTQFYPLIDVNVNFLGDAC